MKIMPRSTLTSMIDQEPMETTIGTALLCTGLIPVITLPWPDTTGLTNPAVLIFIVAAFAIAYGLYLLAQAARAATKRRRMWDIATPLEREMFANLPQFGEMTDQQLADFVGVSVHEIRSCRIQRPREGGLGDESHPRMRKAA